MCLYWYDQCVNATDQNKQEQLACQDERNTKCGNLTINDSGAVSTTTRGGGSSATGTGGSGASSTGSSASSTGSAAATSGAAVALEIGSHFGTPLLGAGILALFGFAL